MKTKLKKHYIALALAACICTTIKPANAALLAPVSPLLGITAAGIMLINSSGIRTCTTCYTSDNEATIFGTFIGIILLDGENGQALNFQAIDQKGSEQLGISREAQLIYNSELYKLNQVAGTITKQLLNIPNPTDADSRALWEKYGALLLPETILVARKIVENDFNK